jgi:hypothetical protein
LADKIKKSIIEGLIKERIEELKQLDKESVSYSKEQIEIDASIETLEEVLQMIEFL